MNGWWRLERPTYLPTHDKQIVIIHIIIFGWLRIIHFAKCLMPYALLTTAATAVAASRATILFNCFDASQFFNVMVLSHVSSLLTSYRTHSQHNHFNTTNSQAASVGTPSKLIHYTLTRIKCKRNPFIQCAKLLMLSLPLYTQSNLKTYRIAFWSK